MGKVTRVSVWVVCVGCGAEREVVERREVDGVGKWRA